MIRKIVYEIAIYHLKITSFEDELFQENLNQYVYSERQMDQEPVMAVKLSAGEFFYILAKYDENFVKEFLDFAARKFS